MGRYTRLVSDLHGGAVGLDVSDAVDKAAQLWPDLPLVQADIVAPPFEAGSFDVVYSFGVLHHLPEPIRGWQTCFGLVKPGGLLLAWVYSQHGGVLRRGRRSLRVVAAKWPRLRKPIAAAAAGLIWAVLRGMRLLRRGKQQRSSKLGFYDDKSLSQLYVDCHDALAAPSEMYLTEADCKAWLASIPARESGFERRSDGSGWIIWARA
jgi:SAM-dependent methyltransferase